MPVKSYYELSEEKENGVKLRGLKKWSGLPIKTTMDNNISQYLFFSDVPLAVFFTKLSLGLYFFARIKKSQVS